ncbi:MAG: hypothetical protein Q9181_007432, partial [Wetmoreana brouardii]
MAHSSNSTATSAAVLPPASFDIAFERLRETVSKDDARAFASSKMEDVWAAAKDIERQLERRRSLRGFRRIQPFLTGVEQYSRVIEVACNQTPYLPFIWAPIKLLLQIAQGHIAALEKLIEAYAMIGEAMPRFDKLTEAFKADPQFMQVMGHFYEDLLEFHRRAYKFFRQRVAWTILFESIWKNFNFRFHGILENLRKHRDLIDQEAATIDITESKAWRDRHLEQIRQWRLERAHGLEVKEKERLASQIRETVGWLGASEEQEDIHAKLLRAYESKEAHWLLSESVLLSWIEDGRDCPVVWLNGKPGADFDKVDGKAADDCGMIGKSVACAKVVENIQHNTASTAAFFFCGFHQSSQEKTNGILRNISAQLLCANTSMAPYIIDTFASHGLRPTTKNLQLIVEKLIDSLASVRIVVDGIDETDPNDQKEILGDLLNLKRSSQSSCKMLISTRRQLLISRYLQTKPTIKMEDHSTSVNHMITSFVHAELSDLRRSFGDGIVDQLERQIVEKADGMFLWVKLMMFLLEDIYYVSDIEETLRTLPDGLIAL